MVQLLHIYLTHKRFGMENFMERKHPANLFVRDCITKALFKLMKKKNYHDISISELVKTAGVSRNSFYRNYQSVDDILCQYLIEKASAWWAGFIANPNKYPHVIAEMFRHFLDMKEEINILYKAGLSHILMLHIVSCGKESLTGEISNAYQTAFMSGGLCGLTNEWILRGMKETPDEMEIIFHNQGSA